MFRKDKLMRGVHIPGSDSRCIKILGHVDDFFVITKNKAKTGFLEIQGHNIYNIIKCVLL